MLGKGKATIQGNKALCNVLYVPSATRSLVFVGKLANTCHIITFDAKTCSIVHSHTLQLLDYSGICNPRNGLYNLRPRREVLRHTPSTELCFYTNSTDLHQL